ncbi:hypothetical protein VUR80DRAFT_9731 [Thermomyces stellatus]
MPIFQKDLEQEPPQSRGGFTFQDAPAGSDTPQRTSPQASSPPIDIQTPSRKLSESIRTDLCDGPLLDSPRPATPEQDSQPSYGRAELIERLKRGQSPTWSSGRRDSLCGDQQSYPYEPLLAHSHLESVLRPTQPAPAPKSSRNHSDSPTLLPAAQITPEGAGTGEDERRLRDGLTIDRPRSALHSGDFTHNEQNQRRPAEDEPVTVGHGHGQSASSNLWATDSPPRPRAPFQTPATPRIDDFRSVPPSLSSSLSSSFVYKPPTSPLVQSESNDELDISLPMTGIDLGSQSPSRFRDRTCRSDSSPTQFRFPSSSTPGHQRTPSSRREGTFPYQAHQPRRSLTSTPNVNFQSLQASSPVAPAYLRSRRPSFSSDNSPLQHASMVGSYEESILRGRMSTTPSKPIEFLAQIGVLGLGKCKASLRCPAHVTLPFPAVFYSYPSANAGPGEDGPSPYVGQIDLENGLANSETEQRAKRKTQSRAERAQSEEAGNDARAQRQMRRPSGPRRRSGSPKAPPGGSYRIPEKGQIQIVIKNQNKTAVKLFLVPYDLSGMEPGTKTFIRQRSYSAGPIIDGVPPAPDSADERPVLRYLVHLHICCPSRGRFYLYRNVRVVFANRVPDGKCKLRNETTWPEPRFSPYKAVRVMHPPVTAPSRSAAMLAAEKAFRRRSAGYAAQAPVFEGLRGASSLARPVDPVPFGLPGNERGSLESQSPGGESRGSVEVGKEEEKYEKLRKGDVGYGGNAFFNGRGSPGEESLLSRRLRGLGKPEGERSSGNF